MTPGLRPSSGLPLGCRLGLALCFVLSLGAPSNAAQWTRLSLPQLCELSDDIVRARVLSLEPVRAENGWIFTRYELQVLDRVLPAGDDAPLMTIEQPGGELDGFRQTVSGMQHFAEGEELIVFSGTAANGRRVALAGPRGALRVVDGQLSGLATAFPDIETKDPAVFLEQVRQVIASANDQQ